MLIIYFLLGLGVTTAHSDNGVSYRAQNFDKTVQSIDKEAYLSQREKRFVTGTSYFVPQNVTTKPTWENMNSIRNTTFARPSNTSRPLPNYNTNVTWPVYPTYNYINVRPGYNINGNTTSNASGYTVPVNSVTPRNMPYPGYPGYPAPNTSYQVPNTGYPAQNTGYPTSNTNPGQNYNTNVTRPAYPNYNNIIVRPANKNDFNNSNPSGYNVQPVNPVTPGNKPYYPVPNSGYPAPNTGNLAPNTWYPVPNTGYPASNTSYRVPNTGYPASSGYPTPNNGYSAPNGYPVPLPPPPSSSVIPPANVTGFVPKPNTGFTIHEAVPRNNSTGFNTYGNGFNNNVNGFNNTALANCKCKLPRANSTVTKEERTMDACMIACNSCPAGMKMLAFGICGEDLDYDNE